MRSFAIATLLSATCAVNAIITTVTVGADGKFQYNPPTINATAGDIVSFQFTQVKHAVVQSTLSSPCTKAASGFDSGVLSSSGSPSVWNYTVTSSDPVYFHCDVSTHCKSNGMVGAINVADDVFTQYQALATGTAGSTSGASGASTASGSASGTSTAGTASASSAARQVGASGGSVLSVGMALLVGLAL